MNRDYIKPRSLKHAEFVWKMSRQSWPQWIRVVSLVSRLAGVSLCYVGYAFFLPASGLYEFMEASEDMPRLYSIITATNLLWLVLMGFAYLMFDGVALLILVRMGKFDWVLSDSSDES